MEECASVQTLCVFMTKILRLEALVCGEHGGGNGEAIRACSLRLDNHRATMDDFYARIRTQEWYHDLSEQEEEDMQQSIARDEGHDTNAENQPGVENRPQESMERQNPRPPHASRSNDATALTDEAIQQGIQRLFVAYNQYVTLVAQTDDRLEQFRAAVRRDALELALKVQRTSQDLQHQGQSVEQIKRTLFDVVQGKVDHLEEKFRMFGDHLDGITQTIDRNQVCVLGPDPYSHDLLGKNWC